MNNGSKHHDHSREIHVKSGYLPQRRGGAEDEDLVLCHFDQQERSPELGVGAT